MQINVLFWECCSLWKIQTQTCILLTSVAGSTNEYECRNSSYSCSFHSNRDFFPPFFLSQGGVCKQLSGTWNRPWFFSPFVSIILWNECISREGLEEKTNRKQISMLCLPFPLCHLHPSLNQRSFLHAFLRSLLSFSVTPQPLFPHTPVHPLSVQ